MGRRIRAVIGLLVGFLTLWMPVRGQSLSDAYAQRDVVRDIFGIVRGNNALATRETREPRHAGKTGGHSLWLTWVAPSRGLAILKVRGRGFDPLLGVYREQPGDDPALARLESLTDNDDLPGDTISETQLAVQGGERLEIAVDGALGGVGELELEYRLIPTDQPIPVLVKRTSDAALRLGESVTFAVDVSNSDDVEFRWLLNGKEVDNGEEPILILPRLREQDIGIYQLRVKLDGLVLLSEPIELQVNSEGATTVLARNKVEDALDSSLKGIASPNHGKARPAGPGTGTAQGYNGTQIFNTILATRDPQEPAHCGAEGTGSYWFAYQPPENGTLRLDTGGTGFRTTITVYTYDPPLTSYGDLKAVGCDPGGEGARSMVQVAVEKGRSYVVVLEGLDAKRGNIHLNYSLEPAASTMERPAALDESLDATLPVGSILHLRPGWKGGPPASFQWFRNGTLLDGETNQVYEKHALDLEQSGAYQQVAWNLGGSATSRVAQIRILQPPSVTGLSAQWMAMVGETVKWEPQISGGGTIQVEWRRLEDHATVGTDSVLQLTSVGLGSAGTYQCIVSNEVGSAQSTPVHLAIWQPLQVERTHSGTVRLRWGSRGLIQARVEHCSCLQPTAGDWMPLSTQTPDADGRTLLDLAESPEPIALFRLKIEAIPGQP